MTSQRPASILLPETITLDLPHYRTVYDRYVGPPTHYDGSLTRCRWSKNKTIIRFDTPNIGSITVDETEVGMYLQHRMKVFDPSGVEILELIGQRNFSHASIQWCEGLLSSSFSMMSIPDESANPVDNRESPIIAVTRYYDSIQHLLAMTNMNDSLQQVAGSRYNAHNPDQDYVRFEREHSFSEISDSPPNITCKTFLGDFRITPQGTLQSKNPTTGRYVDNTLSPDPAQEATLSQLRQRWGFPKDSNLYQELVSRILLLTPQRYQNKMIEAIQPWYDLIPMIRTLFPLSFVPMDEPQPSLATIWRASYSQEPLIQGHTWSYSILEGENYRILKKI